MGMKFNEVSAPSKPSELESSSNFGDEFITYFKFWHTLGISLFKIKICDRTGRCEITKPTWFQKGLHLLWFLMWLSYVYKVFRWADTTRFHQIRFFRFSMVVGVCICYSFFFICIRWKLSVLVDMINLSRQSNYENKPFQTPKPVKKSTIFLIGLVTLQNFTVQMLRAAEWAEWDFNKAYIHYFSRAGANMLLWKPKDFDENLDPVLMFLLFIVGFIPIFASNFIESGVVSLAIISGKEMMAYLRKVKVRLKTASINEGLNEFFKLRALLHKNGKALGLMECGLVFGFLPNLCVIVPKIMRPTGAFSFLDNMRFSLVPLTFLTFTAYFTHKANKMFEDWLYQENNFLKLEEPYFSVVLQHLGNGGFKYHASSFINFTSSFLAEIISLIFTFAVVIIQYT